MDELLFIQKISLLLYKTKKDDLKHQTPFKKLKEWNLMFATSCIMMREEEYNVSIHGKELSEANTLKELYSIIKTAQYIKSSK